MGVEDHCRRSGQDVVFTTFQYEPTDRFPTAAMPRILGERGSMEGLLVAGTNYPNFLAYLNSLRQPYVYFGNNLVTGSLELPASGCVSFDETGGGRLAAEYLADLGHRRLAFAGDLSRSWYRRRYEGFAAALRERSIEPVLIDSAAPPDAFELGRHAAEVLLRDHPAVTAVLAQDDETACGLLDVLRRRGVPVPATLSVMGYDDISEIQYLTPALTTIRVPKEEIGRTMASELLHLRGHGAHPRPAALLEASVIVRDSCAPPKNL